MRLSHSIYFIMITLFLIFSCQDNQSENKEDILFTESYETLPDYQWLKNYRNFDDENYMKIVKKHFDKNVEEKKFENAAAYLMVSGNIIDGKQIYDSVYLKNSVAFFKNYKNHISKEAQSHLCYYIGNLYYSKNDIEESIKWLKECIEIVAKTDSHKKVQGFASFSIAQTYLDKQELELSEKYLINALKIFKEIGEIRNQGTVYLLLHKIYNQNKAYEESEKFINEAMKIFKEDKNCAPLLFSAYSFYVDFYLEQKDTLEALKRIDSLTNYANRWKNISDYQKGIATHRKVFKHIVALQKDSAFHYIQQEKEIAEKTGKRSITVNRLNDEILFSKTFNEPLKNVAEVEEFYNELSNEKEQNLRSMENVGSALFNYFSDNNDFEKANKYAIDLIDVANQQNDALTKGRLFELERKFATEQKENMILIQEKKLDDQNRIILLLIVITIFIVLIFIIVFVWTKNRSILKEKEITENYAAQLLQKTEKERKRIASDLHDSVSNELINLRHTIANNNSQLKSKIDFILEEVRNISRNISPTLFDKIGLKLSVEQLIERIQNQHNFFISSEIDYHGGLDNDKELQLYRILQEAITNILKHANAMAGKISIEENEKSIHVEIKDNGKGFDVPKMLEKGNCFGLLNISERVKYLNGTVNFQSDSSGTIIKITIPK